MHAGPGHDVDDRDSARAFGDPIDHDEAGDGKLNDARVAVVDFESLPPDRTRGLRR